MKNNSTNESLYTAKGNFQVIVNEISVGMPATGARVVIKSKDGKILYDLVTNDVGKTPVVELACPPIDLSLKPNQPTPYGEYDVEVSLNGFNPVRVLNCEVFDDRDAIQTVNLKPSNGNPIMEIIVIDPNVQNGNYPPHIPEDPVKEMPPSTGFVVLDAVVVPEYIIVHDGVPDDESAPNYEVPFKDYIKNVASSEIYDTWPIATIEANVYAIISFTLNRVFTEWYRNKGYDFTITGVTSHDQKFTYGRTIFKEISQVVDEIFTTYIAKPNITQPYFSQYCDGIETQCAGLSQWGSKDLGDLGYSAIEILKYFYGDDTYLDEATKVDGIPQSYPGTPLRVGSSGEDVVTIQTELNSISNNYPHIPKVEVDGIFGSKTEASVKVFQEEFFLYPDGIVGEATWYKLSEIYVAVEKMAAL